MRARSNDVVQGLGIFFVDVMAGKKASNEMSISPIRCGAKHFITSLFTVVLPVLELKISPGIKKGWAAQL